jgi:hypothetical protein
VSGALSSIFSGAPVPPQPTQADTSVSNPLWLQQYVYNLGNAATNLAGQNYTPVPFPQVAGPSGATQQSWNMATGNVGNWGPALAYATNLAKAGSTPISSTDINQYMSPYTGQVVGALQNASNWNLFNQQLPGIQAQFVSAGQGASPQEGQQYNNALYLSNQALDQATSQALQSGYQGALNTALAEQQAKQTGASQLGQIGALTSQLSALDTGQVAAAGQAQDTLAQTNINAALNNFYAQQQWPYQNLAFASNIIRGQNVPSNTQAVGTAYYPGQAFAPSPLSSFVGTTLGASSLLNGGNTQTAANSNSPNSSSNTSTSNVLSNGGAGRRGGRVAGALSRVA